MTQQVIGVGSAPDDGTGDPARTAFQKVNSNFTELYASVTSITTKQFGAVGDGVTDDTAAVQAAINYAITNNRSITVVGLCKITASLIINRLVNAQTNVLTISGAGSGEGFLVAAGVTLFDSTLVGTPPQSDYVQFDNLHFQAVTVSDASTFVISKNFLRVMFNQCNFYKIKCVNSSTYLESWYWNSCTVESWAAGWFVNCAGCYDLSIINNCVEGMSAGGSTAGFFQSYDATATQAPIGVRIIGNLIEGCAGSAIALDQCRGVTIQSNYFEGNGDLTHQCIKLDLNGSAVHSGLKIDSNFFGHNPSNPTAYNIKWGPCQQASTTNNFTYDYLHDNSSIGASTFNVDSIGDQANLGLWSDPFGSVGNVSANFGNGVSANSKGGVALYVNGSSANSLAYINGATSGSSNLVWQTNGSTIGYIGDRNGITGGTALDFAIRAQGGFAIATGGASEAVAITSTRNVTINAPSSGTALTLTGASTNIVVSVVTAVGATPITVTDGTCQSWWYTNGASGIGFGTQTAHPVSIYANNAARVQVSSTGNVTINAPSSGNSLVVKTTSDNNLYLDATGQYAAMYWSISGVSKVQAYWDNTNHKFLIGSTSDASGTLALTYGVNSTGLTCSAVGSFTINAPSSGDALSITNVAGGNAAVINGNAAGTAVVRLNTQATTGAQTATFVATNKPGSGTTSPAKWIPINLDGTTHYIPAWT